MADVLAVAVGVAVADGEAVGEAGQALGNAVNVAGDALLQRVGLAALDGRGGVGVRVVQGNLSL